MKNINSKKIAQSLCEPIELYRYMTIDRFFKNLKSYSNMFSMPFSWNDYDPFKDLLSKVLSSSNNGFEITNNSYSQCWSTGHECDGMRKNYTTPNLDNEIINQIISMDSVEKAQYKNQLKRIK